LLVAAAIMSTVFVLSTPTAGACSCAGTSDQIAFDNADVVFVGELRSHVFDEDPDGDGLISSLDPAVWTFAVDGVYKGSTRQTTAIYSANSGASCGLEIPKSGTFFVFANWINADNAGPGYPIGELTASLCGGTRAALPDALDLDPPIESVAPIADPAAPTTTLVAPTTAADDLAEPFTGGSVLVIGFIAVGIIGAFVASRIAKKSRET
jgi:hypothetical protein